MTSILILFTTQVLPFLVHRTTVRALVWSLFTLLLLLCLAAVIGRKGVFERAERVADGLTSRTRGWGILFLLVFGALSLSTLIPTRALEFAESSMGSLTSDRDWLTGDSRLFLGTFGMAWVGFYWTYQTCGPDSRERASTDERMTKQMVRLRVVKPSGIRVRSGSACCSHGRGSPFSCARSTV